MPAIKYQFIADGQATVRDAFKSIGDEARDSSKAIEQGMRAIRTSSRVSSAETLRNQKAEAERNKVVESAIDIRRKQAQELAKQVSADQAAQSKIAKTEQRELDKRRKEISKDVDARKKLQEKNADHERKHQEKLARIKRVQQERSDRDSKKLLEQENKHQQNIVATRAKYDGIFRAKKEALQGGDRFGALKATARGAFIGTSAAVVASMLGIAGSAARQSLALHEVSNRLSISARGANEESVDPHTLRKEFEQTAAKTPGIKAMDVAQAVQQFVAKTGNLDVARKSQGVFATVASATGSDIADVSAAAADLFQKFEIDTVEGMADAMAALAFQGKAGSFELKDAAGQFAKLSAAASRFGLAKGADGVRTLGGLTQIARSATGSPEQAATAVEAMFRQFTSSSALKQLKSIRVDPFLDKGKTQTKEIRGLIVETITKSGGNLEKLQHIFGEEGIRAISPIISEFNKAKQAASVGGASAKDSNAAGETAARDYINLMIDAPGDFAELQRDAAQAQQDASAKMARAWENIVAAVSDDAIPAIGKLVETIENSPGVLDAFIGTIENIVWYFGALIEATQAVMEYFNLTSKKKKSPEEKEAEARKKATDLQTRLDRFDKKRGGKVEDLVTMADEVAQLRKAKKFKEADAKDRELNALKERLGVGTAGDTAAKISKLMSEAEEARAKGDVSGAAKKDKQISEIKNNYDKIQNEDAERLAIFAKLEMAKKDVGLARGERLKIQDQQSRIRSSDTFATEYASMLDASDPSNKDANLVRAKAVATALSSGSSDDYLLKQEKMGNESDEAFQFRTRQMQARKESASLTPEGKSGNASPADMAAAMAKVEAAAKAMEQAAAKLGGLGQASIVPQP